MIQMNRIFSDNMVLQRGEPVAVFGKAAPQSRVKVAVPERNIEVVVAASKDGEFFAKLPSQDAGASVTLIVSELESGSTKQFFNVRYGEVWMAAGQSNMEFELQNAKQGVSELMSLKEMREQGEEQGVYYYFAEKMGYESEEAKKREEAACWHSVVEEDARRLSAVGYFAAKELARQLSVPVGIINCNHGGTSISCWMDKSYLNSFADGAWYVKQYEELVKDKTNEEYLEEMEEYKKTLQEYQELTKRLLEEASERGESLSGEQLNELAGPYPWPEPQGWLSPYRPGGLYETMLTKLTPYTMKGVWFYQGEEDGPRSPRYEVMLTHLIAEWREIFQKELPFVIMQLPMFLEKGLEEQGYFTGIRRAQEMVSQKVSNVTLVPLCDLGEYDNIHPIDKKTPGLRLGRMTYSTIYDEKEEVRPMKYAGYFMEAGTLTVYFDEMAGGFMINEAKQGEEPNLITVDEAREKEVAISGFEIAGTDGIFYPADAVVERSFVILSSRDVPSPMAVQYGQKDFICCNLYNKQGIPLIPFGM